MVQSGRRSQLFLQILSENSIKIKWERFQCDTLSGLEAAWALVPNRHSGPYAPHGVQIEQLKYTCVGFRHTLTYPASLNEI